MAWVISGVEVRAELGGQLAVLGDDLGGVPAGEHDARGGGDLLDRVLGLGGHVPEVVLQVHAADQELGLQADVLLDVELVPHVAQALDLGDVHVADLGIGLAVLELVGAEDGDGAHAEVPERGGRADLRDDLRGRLRQVYLLAAVVGVGEGGGGARLRGVRGGGGGRGRRLPAAGGEGQEGAQAGGRRDESPTGYRHLELLR
ncbi:hypothetical protein ACFQGX_03420 [Nonomuraea dietziae]|uniref:hypothetical protein n=1 Tax=Nonomuraea dietziae TaxID=65515 RepID=UPI00361505AE